MNADIRTVLSLCAGYGGLDLGFHRAVSGSRTVCYVENEIPATAILAHNIEKGRLDDAPIWSDLKTFDPRPFRGRVDAILGGYPCQPFSVAGQRRGTEDPRHLWPYIARIVDVIRPRICVCENVRGHVRLGLSEVLGELGRIGYRVRAGIFSAAEVGAPHRRERVFIVGVLEHPTRIAEREQDDETSTEPRNDSWSMLGGRRSAMADSIREGLQGHARDGAGSHEPGRISQEQDGSIGAGGVLANPARDRNKREKRNIREEDRGQGGALFWELIGSGDWPSLPGESQHEWEEPRTIDRKLNPSWVAQLMGLPHDWVEVPGLTREMKLRALGNGVVPQQADLAIRTLRAEPLQSQEPQGSPSQT